MKLLCFGDLHLGQGADLGRAPGDRLSDQQHVLEQIATLAFDRHVDGVLFAGDAFEGPTIAPEQLQLFARFVHALHACEIPVLAITGNGKHDAAMRTTNGLAIFEHVPGITVSSTPDVFNFAGCAVATLPWVSSARLVAARGSDVSRDEIHASVAAMLVDVAARGKEDCERVAPGAPHILLGHWSVTGSALPNGLPVADLREPVIPIAELDQLGYSHIVLGHIHRPQQVGDRGFYVGSPLPLNFGETHTDHGVTIVDLGASSTEFVPVDSRPLLTIDADVSVVEGDAHNAIVDVIDSFDVGRAIVRLRYRATSEQHKHLDAGVLRRILLEDGAHVAKIVPDVIRVERGRGEGVDAETGELEIFDRWCQVYEFPADAADRMRAKLAHYLEQVAA